MDKSVQVENRINLSWLHSGIACGLQSVVKFVKFGIWDKSPDPTGYL